MPAAALRYDASSSASTPTTSSVCATPTTPRFSFRIGAFARGSSRRRGDPPHRGAPAIGTRHRFDLFLNVRAGSVARSVAPEASTTLAASASPASMLMPPPSRGVPRQLPPPLQVWPGKQSPRAARYAGVVLHAAERLTHAAAQCASVTHSTQRLVAVLQWGSIASPRNSPRCTVLHAFVFWQVMPAAQWLLTTHTSQVPPIHVA